MISFTQFAEAMDEDIAFAEKLMNQLAYKVGWSADEVSAMSGEKIREALGENVSARMIALVKWIANGKTTWGKDV